MKRAWVLLFIVACIQNRDTASPIDAQAESGVYTLAPRMTFEEALGPCMDAELADLDGDGMIDVVLAFEYDQNVILWNQGEMTFEPQRLPRPKAVPAPYLGADSEDVAILDIEGDDDLDLLFVSEDLGGPELYLWEDGAFVDATDQLPEAGITNGLDHADLNGDGLPEVVLAQRGQNLLWSADGAGSFVDVTEDWLPTLADNSQDAELADLDGDSLLDLVIANENADNRVLFQRGDAFEAGDFPTTSNEETREIDAGDLDGDGDLDLVLANVGWGAGAEQDRVLFNDGQGGFTPSSLAIPEDLFNTLDIDLIDLDGDGDLDVLRANSMVVSGRLVEAPFEAWLNDGDGGMTLADTSLLPWVDGKGLDVEAGDLDGDGQQDLYFCVLEGRDAIVTHQ